MASQNRDCQRVPQNDDTISDGIRSVNHPTDGLVRDDCDHDPEQVYSSRICSTKRSNSQWMILKLLILFFTAALFGNILISIRSNHTTTETAAAEAPEEESVVVDGVVLSRISTKLNNTTIPNWKPLPNPSHTISKIAFGSCSSQAMPQPHWDTVALYQPDIFILMGDNVYGDCKNDDSCGRLRDAYLHLSRHPSVIGGASTLPVMATLDDHDYGQQDCHSSNPHKDLAKDLFQEFFQLMDLPNDGVYQSNIWGSNEEERLQVILLDTRYARSPFEETGMSSSPYRPPINNTVGPNDQRNMLSSAQWTWLEQQLAKPANVRLVVSSVQVLNQKTGFEAWRHLPSERERFVDLLHNKSALLLTGDRHVGGFYESQGLVEVTASSFTHTLPFGVFDDCNSAAECDEDDPARLGDFVRTNHFGSVEVDWDASTLKVTLRHSENSFGSTYGENSQSHDNQKQGDAGQEIRSKVYKFSDL